MLFRTMDFLSNLLKRKLKTPVDSVLDALTKGFCPDCNGREFLMGPHGGMCQNIQCANEKCGSRFNCAPFDDAWLGQPFMAERIGKASDDCATNQ